MRATSAGPIDLFRLHAKEYTAPSVPTLVRMPPAKYLAARGMGAPGSLEFQARLHQLYSVAFTLKFQQKATGHDFRGMPLEGLYEMPPPGAARHARVPVGWTLLIRVPDSTRATHLKPAFRALAARGKPVAADAVRLVTLREGQAVQLLHVGPWNGEAPSVERMESFARDHALTLAGPHHEIYLSDPRRVKGERLRTILRYPTAAVV